MMVMDELEAGQRTLEDGETNFKMDLFTANLGLQMTEYVSDRLTYHLFFCIHWHNSLTSKFSLIPKPNTFPFPDLFLMWFLILKQIHHSRFLIVLSTAQAFCVINSHLIQKCLFWKFLKAVNSFKYCRHPHPRINDQRKERSLNSFYYFGKTRKVFMTAKAVHNKSFVVIYDTS